MIELPRDKKHRELKRSLQNNMIESHNRCPEDKQIYRPMSSKLKGTVVSSDINRQRGGDSNTKNDRDRTGITHSRVSFSNEPTRLKNQQWQAQIESQRKFCCCWICCRPGHRSLMRLNTENSRMILRCMSNACAKCKTHSQIHAAIFDLVRHQTHLQLSIE